MSKFNIKPSTVEIVDLTENEIYAILKMNFQSAIVFSKDGKPFDAITLNQRIEKNGIKYISYSTLTEKNKFSKYEDLFKLIVEKAQIGIVSIEIDKKIFQNKEPLILMIDTINPSLIQSCIFIDYDNKKKIFTVMNKLIKGSMYDKLYYFEDNDSILAFSQDGPVLIYGKTQSVEDVLCV